MIIPTRVFLHYLEQLKNLLQKVEKFEEDITNSRLYPDMFPLLQQAKTAISFTLRCTCPLAGREIVSFSDSEYSLKSTFAELEATAAYLSAIPDEDFGRIDILEINTAAGFADLKLNGWNYYIMYSLPNFFFHYCMVYAIARQAGVRIGKADFDSYHKYPIGFNFTDEDDASDNNEKS
jgi:hypothetical protein